jgi:hypothetical protein
MNLEDIKIVHAIPGRMRLKVADVRENPTLAGELQRRLTSLSGVRKVEVNPRTGSVLILYEATAFASAEALQELAKPLAEIFPGLEINEVRSWMSSANGSGSAPSLTQGIASFFAGLNKNIDAATGSAVDLRILLPLGLFIFGLRSLLISDKRPLPTWYDFFWFALGTYFMLHPKPGEQPPP